MQRAIDVMTTAVEKDRDDAVVCYENRAYAYQDFVDKGLVGMTLHVAFS